MRWGMDPVLLIAKLWSVASSTPSRSSLYIICFCCVAILGVEGWVDWLTLTYRIGPS